MRPAGRQTRSNFSARGTALPGIVCPNPLPLTPDQWRSTRRDLRSATDGREGALGHRGAAVDKWAREWPFANGRTAIDEHRRRGERASSLRHARLHALRREVFPVDALDRAVPRLERHDHRSQEYPQAQHARKASSNSLSDGHCDSFDLAHQQNRQCIDFPLAGGPAAFSDHTPRAAPVGLGTAGSPYIVVRDTLRSSPAGSIRVRLH
jgi:hypothetical protein